MSIPTLFQKKIKAPPPFDVEVPDPTGRTVPRTLNDVPHSTPTSTAYSTIQAVQRTSQAREHVLTADQLTDTINGVSQYVRKSHAAALADQLSVRTQQQSKKAPLEMLDSLEEMGFSWRAVARMLGVSVPALRKWRRGEKLSGQNRRKLSTFMAGINTLSTNLEIQDIASWFETPLLDEIPVTPIDLWAGNQYVLALRYASEELSAAETLDVFEPDWHIKWKRNFERVVADDGHISLVRKEGQGWKS